MSRLQTLESLRQLVAEVGGQTKTAAVKKASTDDPGGYDGGSSHPSANADDGTIAATTGARAAENEKDVKNNREAGSVDATPVAKPVTGSGDQDKQQLNIGTVQSATGEQPSVEDDYKGEHSDPGTAHPANTEQLGEKYSADLTARFAAMPFDKLAAHAIQLSNAVLADVATGKFSPATPAPVKQAADNAAPDPKADQAPAANADAITKAAQAGYAAAAAAAAPTDEAAVRFIAGTIKEAHYQADLVADYLDRFAAAAQTKQAGDEEPDSDDKPADQPPAEAGGGEAGGAALPGPGDVAGAMDSMGGGAVNPEEAVQALAAALMEMGVTPEMLMQAMEGGGAPPADAGGGMGLEAGGAPPVDPMAGMPKAAMQKAANLRAALPQVVALQRSGKFAFGMAKTAREASLRNSMRGYVAEVLGALNR